MIGVQLPPGLKERTESLVEELKEVAARSQDRGQDEAGCEASRPAAKRRLAQIVGSLRNQGNLLECLANQLPTVLTPQADQALWSLLEASWVDGV